MLVIGLTGGIGTGKSEVSRILRELGAEVIDADRVGHEAYLPHTDTWQAVVDAFGAQVLQSNGEIDRKKLGAIVFSDPQARQKLNGIMHPRMYRMMAERIEAFKKQGVKVVVVEAAILIEGGWAPLADEVWVTTAPEASVTARIQARNNLSPEEIHRRIRSQLSDEERFKHAHVIIENNGDKAQLRAKVEELWESRVKGRV